MQRDSMHFSTSDHMTHNQPITEEALIKFLQCSHCPFVFKSRVFLFEHLNKVHGFDVDTALREAGLKHPEVNTDNISGSSGSTFSCQHCVFTSCSWDVFSEHEKQCNEKSGNQNGMGKLFISENQESRITVISTHQHKEGLGIKEILAARSTSKSACTHNSSKDLKTYKRPLQTITKYFSPASGSNGKPTVKLAESPVLLDSTKETLLLQESPSSSNPNSSGVFKVTAKSMIDISKRGSDLFLLNDHLLIADLRSPTPNEQLKETSPSNVGKRTNSEHSESSPAKKAKRDNKKTKSPEKANVNKQQSPGSTDFSFEVSEDEEEKRLSLRNGDKERPRVYFCKHCDYSNVGIRNLSAHYHNDHPYIRYNAVYIRDPNDQSATFRCLECPVEFASVADLGRHYTENHPDAPQVFAMSSHELSLVFKCFLCPFTTNVLKALKEHYKEEHPNHEVENSLLYCRYSTTRCQEESSQLNACENTHCPERSDGISLKNANAQHEDINNPPSPQHPTSKGADGVLYRCNNCDFSHKSVVVMHIHYQKSHPDEAVTMGTIKHSSCATSPTTSEMMPEKSLTTTENSTPQRSISDSSKKAKGKAQLSQQKISFSLVSLKHTPGTQIHSESSKTEKAKSSEDVSKTKTSPTKCDRGISAGMHSLYPSSPTEMFYCQFCIYSSTNIRSVVAHHNSKHFAHGLRGTDEISAYSAEVQKKKLQREAEASASTTSFDSKISKQVEVCSGKEPQHEEGDSSMTRFNPYACAEKLFYCQKCNFANPTVKGVLRHQSIIHRRINSSTISIIEYTTLVHDEIEKSKFHTKELPFSTHLPLPLMNEGDEDMFFCHFCNYRQMTVNQVIRHYFKRHRGFEAKAEQVQQYTSVVLKQTQKLHRETTANREMDHVSSGKKGNQNSQTDAKCLSVSVSPTQRDRQTQRTLQCHRCTYSSQYVYLLRRHMWKIHRANRSVNEVLRLCFKQGALQSGYYCDFCVFSDKNAARVYKHYQDQHPGRNISLQYISTRLYVGPDMPPSKRKKSQIKRTDGISDGDSSDGSFLSQRCGQNETKAYSCRACSFKGSSMSGLTRHYRAIHPWSVKEDGSVLNVITSKRPGANSHMEDQNETTYQVPPEPEFGRSPGSSHEAAVSPILLKCPFCPASFNSQHGLSTHCGMKHREALSEKVDEEQEQQVQTQTRVHVFKCPYCTYINTSYQGVLTHCQMKHPASVSRADSLHVDETHLRTWDDGSKRKGHGDSLRVSGYMCKTCRQIYATLEKLNKHCEDNHSETVPDKSEPAGKPPAVNKIQLSKTHSTLGSVSKASFLRKKVYAVIKCQHCSYVCSTKIALSRHLCVHYRNSPAAKVCAYKCVLCSKPYFRKKRLGNHYTLQHGKDAFLKYFVPVYKQVPGKPGLTSPDCPLTQQPESTSEACESRAETEKGNVLLYKCPSCPYVNASHHGTLTHCQMKHPTVIARADELQTEDVLVTNMIGCTSGKGSNERGYMCKKCPQIHASLAKLKTHCERDHNQCSPAASEHSAEIETEEQPDHGSVSEAAANPMETDVSQQLETPDTRQVSAQNEKSLYKCYICAYTGLHRRYLHSHYKKTHKLDARNTYKLLEEYNKRKARKLPEDASEESVQVQCKKCPDLMFDSSQLLIDHYSTFHSSDWKLDFTVLSRESTKSTGIYKCAHCRKELNGISRLCRHLDCHRARNKRAKAAKTEASFVITSSPPPLPPPPPEAASTELCRQDELPMLETVEDLTQWNVKPVETFTLPASPRSSPAKPTDPELPEPKSRKDRHSCRHCRRTFMSLKGLRLHERSHATMAAIKKLDHLPTSALKHNINKYIIYKSGTVRPFLCSFCSYRTTVLGLWRSHFMKNHQDVLMDPVETDEDEESANKEPSNLSEEKSNLPEPDEEPVMTEKSLYLEPPDVQRQLNHYSLMTQSGVLSNGNQPETKLPENSLLHCEFCNFSTGHLSSIRRHYLNRHGKKILRCKDCNFFTGLRKTLEMHTETGHSTCQSEPTHQKDLRCPFCLYKTKNKNNMIDHIVLHREERVVPIEVRRLKLSRYLQGIVFRCHKCTFTSGSAENLRLHMTRHDDIKPYKCRLCYFDCTLLNDLEAHLSDKHQVLRNHELVGQVSLDQLEARSVRMPEEEEEPLSNSEHHSNEGEDVEEDEFVTDYNEVRHETQAENPAENHIRKKSALQLKEACQKQERETQERAGNRPLPDTARGQRTEDVVEQNVGNAPETQQKRGSAEGSTKAYGKIAQKTELLKLNIKLLQHRKLNIEAGVDDVRLHHSLLLGEDGSTHKMHKKADQDTMVKKEQSPETNFVDNTSSKMLDEDGLVHNSKIKVDSEAKKSHMRKNNIRGPEIFKAERHWLTLPSCAQLKVSHKESLGASFPNCKEEQVRNQKNSEGATDAYGEMPVLENEYLKEEMHPLGCCKEEEESDHFEPRPDEEDEVFTEDDKNRRKDREREEGGRITEADNAHVRKSAATGGAADVLCPAVAEKKLYTCELCGRNLLNISELKRHVMRHGI